MLAYLWIGLGGAIGSILRHGLNMLVVQRFGDGFPLGTLLVNVTGSFLIGWIAFSGHPEGRMFLMPIPRDFLMIGILGGYTTFSSFSLQTLSLAQNGHPGLAAWNIALSLGLCLLGVWLGQTVAHLIRG